MYAQKSQRRSFDATGRFLSEDLLAGHGAGTVEMSCTGRTETTIREGAEKSIITTSVDDMLIASSSADESNSVVTALATQFEITDNGEPTLHLGCSLERDRTICVRVCLRKSNPTV